jgi:hypothetical protein
LWPSAQGEEDRYLTQLIQQYPLQQAKLRELYATYGFSLLALAARDGHAVLECLSSPFAIETLMMTAARPQPFAELKEKFSLADAVHITYALCAPDEDLRAWQEEIVACLAQDSDTKKLAGFYTDASPLLDLLYKRVRFATIFERIWEPSKKKELLKRLMALTEEEREQIRQSPLALPYLLVTGELGSKVLQVGGGDFLYFLSLIRAEEWYNFSNIAMRDSKPFLAALEAYGLPAYHYWLRQGVLLEKLLQVFNDDTTRLGDFQKAVLFLYANRDTLRKYQQESDFPDKVADALHILKMVSLPHSELTLAERCLVEPNLFRLAYEYPDLSQIPLAQFAGCEVALADLLYRGALSPHMTTILQTMQHRGHAEMIYRGLLQYHSNEQFAAIIGKMGGRGMLVAINLDPNKYWHELLQEGHGNLRTYEILDNGTIRVHKPSAGTVEFLADQFLPIPLPLDLARLSERLWKGYYLDTYDYLLAGADVAKCTMAAVELFMSGQEEGTEVVDAWIRLAIKAAKTALRESSKYIEDRKTKEKQQFGRQFFLRQVNDWLLQKQGKTTLQAHKQHLRHFLSEFASDSQRLQITAEISQMEKEMQRTIYSRQLPERIQAYTFSDYRSERKQSAATMEPSPAISALTYYMLQNMADTPLSAEKK